MNSLLCNLKKYIIALLLCLIWPGILFAVDSNRESAYAGELYPEKAPIGVNNFLMYVNSGFYDGLIFHRVIPGFMIQGGGFDKDLNKKATKPPIKNEADNGLNNDRGTLAYARPYVVDSATSQFFINHRDNPSLNFRSKTKERSEKFR